MTTAADLNAMTGQNPIGQGNRAEDIFNKAKGDDELVTKDELKDYLTEEMGLSDDAADKIVQDVFGDNDQLNMTDFADKNEDLMTGILAAK